MDDFLEALEQAMRPEVREVRAVKLTTPDGGTELLFYGGGPGYADGGTLVIPPGILPEG